MAGKVAFFITSLNSGGIENYLLRFLRYKSKDLKEIIIYCKSGNGGQLEEYYKNISNLVIVKIKTSLFNPIHYLKLLRFFKKTQCDCVCDFTGNFAGLIIKTAQKAGVTKRIAFYRGSTDHFKKTFPKKIYNNLVKQLVYKNATDILSNSKAAFDYFYPKIWSKDERFDVIYNGLDAADFINEKRNLRSELGIPKDAFVVGHTGRYNAAKNHSTILQVAKILITQHKNFYFILCGNRVKENLGEILQRDGLADRILVFNNRVDIPQFLNTMDCYYFPSLTEGQPNSLIEAMIMNIPIVAADIPSIRETVPECAHSYLVPPQDENKAIEKIVAIYNKKYNLNLQQWAIQNFNSEKLFNQFLKHLECQ